MTLCALRWQFSSLSGGGGAASMAQLMSIVKHQKAVSAKLDGCSGVCVVGATAGLSVCFDAHRVLGRVLKLCLRLRN